MFRNIDNISQQQLGVVLQAAVPRNIRLFLPLAISRAFCVIGRHAGNHGKTLLSLLGCANRFSLALRSFSRYLTQPRNHATSFTNSDRM